MKEDRYLFDLLLNQLSVIDSNNHSCLNDMICLRDYRYIINQKLEDEDEFDIRDCYKSQYRFYVKAEKIKKYIEQNVEEYFEINEWELFVRLKNGDKFIYDSFSNVVDFITYEDNDLSEEQERKEFAKNLKKLMQHKWVNQEELARRLDISQVMISRYVNGQSIPNAMMLKKMAKALDCSTEDFYYKHF